MGRCGAALRLALEGNIAVGKSTFLRLLGRAFPEWHLVAEPVAQWQKVAAGAEEAPGFGNLLQRLYQEPSRWSFTFQTFSCLGRLKAQLERPVGLASPVQVFERSVYSDRYVFAKNLFETGHLDMLEWAIYQEWHSFLLQELGDRATLHGFLYLRATPQRCLERLWRRARVEERGVQLLYLQQLHMQHERWLLERSTKVYFADMRHMPILVLDVDGDFEQDAAMQDILMAQVESFVKSLQTQTVPPHPDPC
ncbi:deoxyguanosine kinase, mitochondrial isoform X1 [Cygnus atratus]|uniref:deoxyguanosine kinase, mitochondrial isoform X1 n=1 Tax=Cygnus atratus TaxID=8868 RepID=UPI0015D5AA01|nr:deoxyguanosine kinase, mitochondrial isoform X1 [Cygnus atratus]